ncbi:MAG TPA: MFS transporter [Azospirillaceae bacterium]|nr:MFS transporter [Azospirillaceae bacterium]
MAGHLGFAGIRAALGQRNFAIYTAGNAVSLVGTWMQRIAIGWLAWELTGSGFWLGLVAFADLFPAVILGPLAGAVSDRFDRLRVAKTTQVLACIQAVSLAVLTHAGVVTIGHLVGLTFLLGTVTAFAQPARLALVPSLVGRDRVAAAIAINAIVFNSARFVGPAAAGAAILGGGVELAFLANAVSFVVAFASLHWVRLVEERPARKPQGLLHDMRDGIAYTVRHPGIGPVLLMFLTSTLLVRPVVELLPGFASAVFDRGAEGLAVLSAAVGTGSIVAGLHLAGRAGTEGLVRLTLLGHAGASLALLAFTATDALWPGALCVAIYGLFVASSGIGTQTLVQVAVEPGMRGRVISLYGMILRGGPAIGALAMGSASEWFGLGPPVAVGAVATLLVALVALRGRKRLAAVLEAPGAASG